MDLEDTDCPQCKALRRGTTWIGKPPKCAKHRNKSAGGVF